MQNLVNVFKANFELYNFVHRNYSGNAENAFYKSFLYEHKEIINWYSISKYAPLDIKEIEDFFEFLDLEALSENLNINWNEELLEKFSQTKYWYKIKENQSVPWNEVLIDKFFEEKNHWEFIGLSSNPNIHWTKYLIKKYFDKLYFNTILKLNKKTFWNIELVEYTIDLYPNHKIEEKRLYLSDFSRIENIEWNLDILIKNNIDYSYWVPDIIEKDTLCFTLEELDCKIHLIPNELFQFIQSSKKIFWNIALIKKFFEKINFKKLSMSSSVEWSFKLIETFEDMWDYKSLSENYTIQFDSKLIDEYFQRLSFSILSGRGNIKWDMNLIDKYSQKINFDEIILTLPTEISAEFVIKYTKKLNWCGSWRKRGGDYSYYASNISKCNSIPIPVNLLFENSKNWVSNCSIGSICNHDDKGEWHYFSENHHITERHLEQFEDKLCWPTLSKNKKLKLNSNLIIAYSKKWDYHVLLDRDDIKWDVDTFLTICDNLNFDHYKVFQEKILSILEPVSKNLNCLIQFSESRFILHNVENNPSSSSNSYSSWNHRFLDKLKSKNKEFVRDIINEANNIHENHNCEMENWLKNYTFLFLEQSFLNIEFRRVNKSFFDREFSDTYLELRNRL